MARFTKDEARVLDSFIEGQAIRLAMMAPLDDEHAEEIRRDREFLAALRAKVAAVAS